MMQNRFKNSLSGITSNFRIIDRYIIRKFLGTFVYAIILLAVVIIIFDISEKIDDFIQKQASLKAIVFDYYLNFLPFFINKFTALFTFISVIFFTSKMAGDTEIIAILNSGVSFKRFLRPYIFGAIVLSLFSFMLTNFVIPKTIHRMIDFESRYVKKQNPTNNTNIHMQIEPGTFVYVESYNSQVNSGYKFTLEKLEKGKGLTYKLEADALVWDTIKRKWSVNNFYERKLLPNGNEIIQKGTTRNIVLNVKPEEFNIDTDNVMYMNFFELRNFIQKEKLKGSSQINRYLVEMHQRFAFPFAGIILTLIGVALSSRKVRGGTGLHLGFGIAITFTYILFLQVTTVFARFGEVPPALGVWTPNIIFGLVAWYLLWKAPK
jgi:lipopolysaccharide export system permease protein